MSSTFDLRIRSSSSLAALGLSLLLAGGLAPGRAAAQGHGRRAASDTSVVAQIEQATAHLRKMLRTLRDNPSLAETWSSREVLEAGVATGRRSASVARELSALSAELDSLLESGAAEESDVLARHLRQVEGSAEEMASSLRSIAARLASLRSVAHGEEGGATHGHPPGGSRRGAASGHHAGLHFSHPLFTESVSPDTKVRLDYGYRDLGAEEGTKHEVGLGLEYALGRSFSVEAGLPYSLTDEALGFTHVSLKFANYALEEHGVSLGYGIGVGLPTSGDAPGGTHHGDEGGGHGHAVRADGSGGTASPPAPRLNGGSGVHASLGRDFYEFEPFFNVGWTSGRWELVGFTTLAVPSGLDEPSEAGTELSWNLSTLFQAAPRVQTLLEVTGTSGLSGHPVGEDVVNLAPGIKLRPSAATPLWLGLGGSLPLTDDRGFDGRLQVSLFYHFR